MFDNYPDVVGVDELCEMLKIGKNSAYRLINDKKILSIRIGRIIKIPKKYIVEFCVNNNKIERLYGIMAL